jgi:hypothetical protein
MGENEGIVCRPNFALSQVVADAVGGGRGACTGREDNRFGWCIVSESSHLNLL